MWYGVTLNRERAEMFKGFLRQEPAILDFEPSECYSNIHIELKTELPFSEVMDRYFDYLRNAVQNAEGNLIQYLKDNPEVLEQIIQAIREEMM